MQNVYNIRCELQKSDLDEVITKKFQKQLTDTEHHSLLQILNTFEDMFDGMLGTCNTTPVELELKENVELVCLRPYPVRKVHKTMSKKEVEMLVNFGFLGEAN